MSKPKVISEHACFGGVQGFYEHASGATGPVPVLFWLAGLTCT
jgi:S-formylglutathione hydrolase